MGFCINIGYLCLRDTVEERKSLKFIRCFPTVTRLGASSVCWVDCCITSLATIGLDCSFKPRAEAKGDFAKRYATKIPITAPEIVY